MRRIVIALGTTLTGLTLLFSWPTSLNKLTTPSAPGAAAVTTSGPTAPGSTAKTYDGAAASTQYGDLQVRITVAGGVVTAAEAVSYPSSNGRDQQINAYAIPILNQEAVAKQSAKISMVSGATYTSNGYATSLQNALDQAGL